MIRYNVIPEMLEGVGIPFAEVNFDQVEVQAPFIAYYEQSRENFDADGVIYYTFVDVCIELIDVIDDNTNMERLEKAMMEHEIRFDKDIDYVYDMQIKSVDYTFKALLK